MRKIKEIYCKKCKTTTTHKVLGKHPTIHEIDGYTLKLNQRACQCYKCGTINNTKYIEEKNRRQAENAIKYNNNNVIVDRNASSIKKSIQTSNPNISIDISLSHRTKEFRELILEAHLIKKSVISKIDRLFYNEDNTLNENYKTLLGSASMADIEDKVFYLKDKDNKLKEYPFFILCYLYYHSIAPMEYCCECGSELTARGDLDESTGEYGTYCFNCTSTSY